MALRTKLPRTEVARLIEELQPTLQYENCRGCDCLQGYLTQLYLDSEEAAHDLIRRHFVDQADIHPCLGCNPCQPADAYARYLRRKQAGGSLAAPRRKGSP